MLNEINNDAEKKMQKCIESLKSDFTRLRTGRAHPSLLEHIRVPYFGVDTPLNQVANIAVEGSRMLTVTTWEKDMVVVVEKAIRTSDLGLNPNTAGNVIRVPLPPLNEERRKELVKVIRESAEDARIAVRNVRRNAMQTLKDLLKDKEITEDEERRSETFVQKLTDKYIAEIDKVVESKESELMTV